MILQITIFALLSCVFHFSSQCVLNYNDQTFEVDNMVVCELLKRYANTYGKNSPNTIRPIDMDSIIRDMYANKDHQIPILKYQRPTSDINKQILDSDISMIDPNLLRGNYKNLPYDPKMLFLNKPSFETEIPISDIYRSQFGIKMPIKSNQLNDWNRNMSPVERSFKNLINKKSSDFEKISKELHKILKLKENLDSTLKDWKPSFLSLKEARRRFILKLLKNREFRLSVLRKFLDARVSSISDQDRSTPSSIIKNGISNGQLSKSIVFELKNKITIGLLKYLNYLETELDSLSLQRDNDILDPSNLKNILLGVTISQAQIESISHKTKMINYINVKLNDIRTKLLTKLNQSDKVFDPNETENSIFNQMKAWYKIFDPKLWSIQKLSQYFGPEGLVQYNELKENDLTTKSNSCILGLLEGCNIQNNCIDIVMEPTTGYSLTHQTLYFILARQLNCTLLNEITTIGLENEIAQRCKQMYEENQTMDNIDLILENTVVCGVENYVQFFTPDWIDKVIGYQLDEGCFRNEDTGRSCEHHMSAVASTFLSLHLRWLTNNE